jgi:hypothetical protein
MGYIEPADAEWALMNRMKALLDQPKRTEYNVTQAVAVFSSILLWSQQRIRTQDPNDLLQQPVANLLGGQRAGTIFDPPWSLSQFVPDRMACPHGGLAAGVPVNQDFRGKTPFEFLVWLRDAFAHGDGRTIGPIHKLNRQGSIAYLGGIRIEFHESKPRRGQPAPPILTCHLFKDDLLGIGRALADSFCEEIAGVGYQNRDSATAQFKDAPQLTRRS